MAKYANRKAVEVNNASPQQSHVPIYDQSTGLWDTIDLYQAISEQTGSASIAGNLVVTGSITTIGGFTGSLEGTASYVLLSNVDGFVDYSASTAELINEKTPLALFNEYTSSIEEFIVIESGSGPLSSSVRINASLIVDGENTFIRSNGLIIRDNYIEINQAEAARGGILVGNLSGSSGTSGSLVWRTDTEAWYGGLLLSESRLLTQIDLDVLNQYTASTDQRLDSLEAETGSYAVTGSNTFIGDQTVTGSVLISSDGLLIFSPREVPTSSIPGALFYSSSGELYVGM